MRIVCNIKKMCVAIVLKNNEIGEMLTFVDNALKKNANLKEKASDFLRKDDETQKYYLFFQPCYKELLIKLLKFIMQTYGIEQNFAAEERVRIAIEKLEAGFGKRQLY